MLPELPWFGWLIIVVIITLTIFLKLPVYKKIFGKKEKEEENALNE